MMTFLWLCGILADAAVFTAGLTLMVISYQDRTALTFYAGLAAAAYGLRELGRLAFARKGTEGGPSA